MRVLRFDTATSPFQILCPDLPAADFLDLMGQWDLDGSSLGRRWQEVPVYVPEPRKPVPDFFTLEGLSGGFVVGPRALAGVGGFLEEVGELLPVKLGRQTLFVCNITAVFDCIDQQASEFRSPGSPKSYAFVEHRLPSVSPFKVEQTVSVDTFCIDPEDDEDDCSFYVQVRQLGLLGLRFSRVWDPVRGMNRDHFLEHLRGEIS